MTANETPNTDRWRQRRSGRLLWGLALAAIGGFWLASNLNIVPQPAKIVVPALVILWGIVALARGR